MAWRDNMLAVYPYLLERLQGIKGIKTVLEAQALDSLTRERSLAPLDGAVYLVFDGFTPREDNSQRREQLFELGFSVILVKRHYTPSPTADSVGAILTQILKALCGFDPIDEDGKALCVRPFKAQNPLPIQYHQGYAFFPTRFVCDVAVLS
ncbi:MAG: hypothetical protein Q4B71_00315 [Cardiobacteriaceae bacterium]|nr:hypothetical protein [Cardiobacteriaceae bacterium]